MSDVQTLDRGWMKGKMRFEQWKEEFERNMVASTVEDMMKLMLAQVPDERLKEMIRQDKTIKPTIERLKGGKYG